MKSAEQNGKAKQRAIELFGVGLTASRLLLASKIANNVKNDQPIGAAMALFIAADIADGIIVRRLGGAKSRPHGALLTVSLTIYRN